MDFGRVAVKRVFQPNTFRISVSPSFFVQDKCSLVCQLGENNRPDDRLRKTFVMALQVVAFFQVINEERRERKVINDPKRQKTFSKLTLQFVV